MSPNHLRGNWSALLGLRTLATHGAATIVVGIAITGCSSNRLALDTRPKLPDFQSVSVPGTADVAKGDTLRHPANVHVAYGRWKEQQQQLPQARESYQLALNHNPRSTEALLGLSRLDRLAGRNQEAERHLQRAEELNPGSPLVSAAWGEHLAATGRWSEAIDRYRFAIQQAPGESIYKHQLAVALTRSGAVQEGLLAFSEIVEPAEAHYNVGYLLQQQGKLLEAEAQYQRALALKPDLNQAQSMLAQVRQSRGVPQQVADRSIKHVAGSDVVPASASTETSATSTAHWETTGDRANMHSTNAVENQPQPPAGLSPMQLEQWKNQQSANQLR